jgi:hypothetical protein
MPHRRAALKSLEPSRGNASPDFQAGPFLQTENVFPGRNPDDQQEKLLLPCSPTTHRNGALDTFVIDENFPATSN